MGAMMPELDTWTREGQLAVGKNTIRVNAEQLKLLQILGVDVIDVVIKDVQALAKQQALENSRIKTNLRAYDFDKYLTYEELHSYMMGKCDERSELCSYESIGSSIQNRTIFGYRVSGGQFKRRGEAVNTDPKIFWSGGQHAREWIGPATVSYLFTQLLEKYGVEEEVTHLMDNLEFVIVPLVNPDGYVYTWTSDRMWRKNRRDNGPLSGVGVDLNRNWGDPQFCEYGASTFTYSDTYCGTGPFSEPESTAVSAYYTAVESEGGVIAAIDWHSYSELVLRPYGDQGMIPDNVAELKTAGSGMVSAIAAVHGVVYTSIASVELYPTTGTASDWYYGFKNFNPEAMRTPLAYTIELRDTGRYGFQLPAAQIIPTGQENWSGQLYFCKYALETYGTP
eukprot:TRINITY_DN10352_c0_g1_i2.p1 TRINITY_DN10352_c0_g1~~TRINITY_DN10352_c0_g1_i2.p1  ORF type:complete len:445 (-),score=53.41 TRINITY_DN10352_c0_g1_i2:52-1233(-)